MIDLISKIYTALMKTSFRSFGEGSIIKPFLNTSHAECISIGKNDDIGSFCRITVSTDFAGKKVKSKNDIRLRIGDNVDIGNNSFLSANNNVQIGNHVIMSAFVFITDHDHGFEDVSKNLHEQPLTEGGNTIIEDNVFLGVKSTVLKNVTIGKHAIIGANSVVTHDIPAYSIAVGNPAVVIKRFNVKTKMWEKVRQS
jgi:acetyltransferase-like isoleucine patch superfamily enzyme